MPKVPTDRKYTDQHDWVLVEDEIATIGITDYAQDSLGDIVYLEAQHEPGKQITAGEQGILLESNKAVSDVFWPISGEIIEINSSVIDNPRIINSDPYGEGWIIKISINNEKELDTLMDADKYGSLLRELED
ncbi:glycine cleavage system H protein [Rickettsiales bacterium]|nr:glycine cleavage system H protein [Rickettsiales bacterium]